MVDHCMVSFPISVTWNIFPHSTEVTTDTRNVKYPPIILGKLFHGLVIFFPSRHAPSVVKSIFHCYVNIKRI